jgi:hypothetical protein
MIFEKNTKTGELAFSNKLSVDGICLLFLMTLKELCHQRLFLNGNEAFFKWQRRIFTIVLNRSFNCLPDGEKNFQFRYIRNVLKKTILFITFSRKDQKENISRKLF